MARWRFWNVFSILPIFSNSLSMKCFKIPISLRKLTLILRFFTENETFEVRFKDESCLFWKCEGEGKRVESHFNHRTNVQKWKGFSALPAHFLMRLCCKKGACNFSTSHFVNHLRWFENMQRRLTGIRHMKSNYLHAIFLSSWDEEKHKLQTCSKKSVLKLLQNPKISTS